MKIKPHIAIHESLEKSFPDKLKRFEKILAFNNVAYQRVNSSTIDFWEKVKKFDGFIFNFVHMDTEFQNAKAILPIIEKRLNIKCFPDQNTCWHFDDKIKQYYLFKAMGFPMADTWIFWNLQDALDWIETASFPVVFKLKGGAGSANVVLINNKKEAVQISRRMFADSGVSFSKIPHKNSLTYLSNIFKLYGLRRYIAKKRGRLGPEGSRPYWQIHRDYVLFQKFFPNNQYDQRVTIIGCKAFSFIRYTRPNDFRASGSGLIDYDRKKNNLECIEIAFRISKKLNFQCMAYDFVFDDIGKPQIIEISYTFVDQAVRDCPGYFDETLHWHEGHYWPQFSILEMFLSGIHIKQPSNSEMQDV